MLSQWVREWVRQWCGLRYTHYGSFYATRARRRGRGTRGHGLIAHGIARRKRVGAAFRFFSLILKKERQKDGARRKPEHGTNPARRAAARRRAGRGAGGMLYTKINRTTRMWDRKFGRDGASVGWRCWCAVSCLPSRAVRGVAVRSRRAVLGAVLALDRAPPRTRFARLYSDSR